MPSFAFRVDASLEIGTGHVMRCMALAQALRKCGATCRFISRDLPGHMADRIADEGFGVSLLPRSEGVTLQDGPPHAHWAGVEWTKDAAQTSVALESNSPDWLVMDHYAFDHRWQRTVCPEGTQLMVIDDLADRAHNCDLLLDQNLGRRPSDYDMLVPEGCTRLIGPRYALLRPEFAEARASALSARKGRPLKRLLISMGGVDAVDATSAVLNALRYASLPEGMEISIIMGGQAPALEKVRALARDMQCTTQIEVDVGGMACRMAAADLAIGAGGATTWERCAVGLPSIIVETANNQASIAAAIVHAGAGLAPSSLQTPGFARELANAVAEFNDPARLGAMSDAAAAACDGEGTERVLAALKIKFVA